MMPEATKCCPCCGETKLLSDFHRNRNTKNGLDYRCKECQRVYDKARYAGRPGVETPTIESKLCPVCGLAKPASAFSRDAGRKDGLFHHCKLCQGVWYIDHKEEHQARMRAYYETHRSAYRETDRRRRAMELGAEDSHDWEEFVELCTILDFRCQGCGRQFASASELTEDHVIPLSRGGNDDIENIQPLCKSCNSSKGVRTMDEWKQLEAIVQC